MKKSCRSFLSLILVLVFMLSVIALTPIHLFADPYFTGDGTEASPFMISTKDQLVQMATLVNAGNPLYHSAYYQMTTNIDLTGIANWIPIGQTELTAFSGYFNGNGHQIIGLKISAEAVSGTSSFYGLFGYNKGQIKQIELVSNALTVTGSNTVCVGGIAGMNSGTISNCINADMVSGQFSGGIAGKNSGTISDCYNMGPVSGEYSGGIAGENLSGTINSCNNTGTVSGTPYGGGITGCNESGTISECYNTGSVTGYRIGGIAGKNSGAISDCYNTSAVSGKNYGGGIAGYNSNGTITDCYNTGTVSGTTYGGGIVGNNESGTITSAYFLDINAVGCGNGSDPTIRCTLEQMKIAATYIGFDFTNIWFLRSDNHYNFPQLRSVDWVLNECTVTFDSKGGSSVNPIITDYFTKITEPTKPTKTGYAFAGWYQDSNLTVAWNFDTDFVKADMTLYAKWTPTSSEAKTTAFVTRFYQLCLNRDPDPSGLSNWVNDLLSGRQTGANVAYGFVFSPEFLNRNVSDTEYVTIMYKAFFNRDPDYGGFKNWTDALKQGMSRYYVLAGFTNSQEFIDLANSFGINPGRLTFTDPADLYPAITKFVTRFYQQCLNRMPDSAGLNNWVGDLQAKRQTGANVAYGFVFSQEFQIRNVSNAEYVTIMYKAFFNRDPDPLGYSGWLGILNNGGSRYSVLAGFVNSQEFKNLCKVYGINPGILS